MKAGGELNFSRFKNSWLKDFNVRQDTIKLLEENIDKTFSDINRTYVFSGQSPKATEIITKTKKRDLIKLTNFYTVRKP